MKGLDPTMALYAAYSYHRLGKRQLIEEMEDYVIGDLQLTFFDLAMLADRESPRTHVPIYPFVPMLAQGWNLLGAFDAWTDLLEELRAHVASSLWTVFAPAALPLLRTGLKGTP
jgi:hypothetical protein